jgi:hypothetical protein
MKKKPTTFERLADRLRNDLDLEVVNLRRVHSGRNMKASGANSWTSELKDSHLEIGSAHTASDLLKAKTIYLVSGWHSSQRDIEISNF